jgi:hypothetical protein
VLLQAVVEGLYYPVNTPMALVGVIKSDRLAHVATRIWKSPQPRLTLQQMLLRNSI